MPQHYTNVSRLGAAVVPVMVLWAGMVALGSPDPKPTEMKGAWGDQGDGTYVNPILPGDYSDLDAIRVGSDYYAISSTLQFSPGMVILHSRDLVNWRIFGHAVEDLTRIGPEMNWDRMDRYGRGVWAGAIRYHASKFWIYFGAPDEGIFMTTAKDAAGPWEPLHRVWQVRGWNDTCPFWDDDGQGYLVATNFARDPNNGKSYNIHLFKLSPDGKGLLMDSDTILHQSRGSEANKLYKINGLYYHFYSEVKDEGRVVMMNRARSLAGPWETRQLNHVNKRLDKEPNQGGLVQVPSGDWWFVTHQGTGDWEGRAMVLLPVTWIDSWPILGRPGDDGIGNMVWRAKKPIDGLPVVIPQTDDDFNGKTLAPQWEWNYQPRAEKWSLTERPGFLRLHAFKPLRYNDLTTAANTLTQRSMRTNANEVTVKLDLRGMTDGQEAGLSHFAGSYCTFGVSQTGDVRALTFNENGKTTAGPVITSGVLWLRSTWDIDGNSLYSYSLDSTTYTPFGSPYRLTWGYYRGDRIGIFSYNNKGDKGYVDVDWFRYAFARPADKEIPLGPRVLILEQGAWLENMTVLDAGPSLVVVDTWSTPQAAARAKVLIDERFHKPVSHVINTHHHWDHTFGNQGFPDAVIVGHRLCVKDDPRFKAIPEVVKDPKLHQANLTLAWQE